MIIEVTAAVIFRGDNILMSTRPPGKHLEGCWEFPGGKLHEFETHYDGLRRELLEELDLRIIPLDIMFSIRHEYKEKTVNITFYRAVPHPEFNFKPVPKEEQEVNFFKLSGLNLLNIVPADKPLVRYLSMVL